ncbi:sulfite exporter TauE/SafE family protein [Alteromonas sp. 1_MG-2023]|uniref:sulfite exporter TauE/SafE family protein n=1 Tax=Alteromonas sp. 1_MG-2023 TaxID=3062669 RepID=UPI0026E338CE|nr:sulfite exporter TauE/SafE family protein [Alteromonas sp. 1_MG-2023]MDO6476051.1 sulfite exporter TauE/SafE family protein [Alteromonas sp. 1_MG-2023]
MEFISENITIILAMMGTGVFAGLLAGLLGVGGGIVIVPVLFFLYQALGISADTAMIVATATSLATIVPTSVSSIMAHNRKGNVDFELLKHWAIFILLGVLAGSYLVTKTDGKWLAMMFGIIATLSALNMLIGKKNAIAQSLPGKGGQSIMATCIGFFSSMVGIGGGTLTVPTLTFCNYPAHRAVGTAAAVGLIISLPAALTMLIVGERPADAPFATFGLVNLLGFACIVPLTVLFAPVGAGIANKLNPAMLKKVFALVLIITGVRMLAQTLIQEFL